MTAQPVELLMGLEVRAVDKTCYRQLPRSQPTPPDQADGRFGAKTGPNLDTAAYATAPRRRAFEVIADPVAQGRPRVAVRGAKAHAYQPARSAQAQWEIRMAALAALGDQEPFTGPVSVTVSAWVRMPLSLPKRARPTALPTRRPDLDNLLKTVLDGCSPLWRDDSQVVTLHAAKRYALGSQPRWSIAVEAVE